MAPENYIGQRLSYDGALCTVRYIGPVAGTSGNWLGVEWDDSGRGKHDGHHKDVRYFTCLSKSLTAASFVRPTRRVDAPQSFVAALHGKYASEAVAADAEREPEIQIVFFGKKPAEEVGFDKIRRQLARVEDLTIVILDGARIAFAVAPGDKAVKETSPLITELDLSRNLFEEFEQVAKICRELEDFARVKELELEETLLNWESLCDIALKFPSLASLSCSLNQLSAIPAVPFGSLVETLTTLTLEFNEFTSFADLASLSSLTSLRNLHLKGNNISAISPASVTAPLFPPSLHYLDISYNAVATWSFVDALPSSFPGLTALRFAHNPIYDRPDPDAAGGTQTKSTDEAHMLTIGRLASLKALNFTPISTADRQNAEMFYLSRIAKQLASVPEAAEPEILAQHARYAELCDAYGAPDVIRRDEINPNYLEARLITVHFTHNSTAQQEVTKTTTIPKSSDIYAVKGIAGRLFGAEPLRLRLVWETGEWDPVGGFDDDDDADYSSDGEDVTAAGRGGEGEQEARGGSASSCKCLSAMPPKTNNIAGPFEGSPPTLLDKKGLSQSMHNPQAEDGPSKTPHSSWPRPEHFIVREGGSKGTFDAIVPLIPADLLPDYMEIVGVPRKMTIGDTAGMSNLGTFAKPEGRFQLRFVSLPPAEGCTARGLPQPNTGNPGVATWVSKPSACPSIPPSLARPAPIPAPRILDWAEDTDSVSTDDFSASEPSAPFSSRSSSGSVNNKRSSQGRHSLNRQEETGEMAERMLEPTSAASADQNLKDTSSYNSNGRPAKPVRSKVPRPAGSLCRHWCQTGQCSWGTECRYTHQMPVTLEGLWDVGLTELPAWWRRAAGLPVEGTIDVRIFAAAAAAVAGGGKKSVPLALGVSASSPTVAAPSKKAKAREDRKTAEEFHLFRLGVERMHTQAASVGMAPKKQAKKVQMLGGEVEKLVDI
ncbi:Tubulin-specific chaperone E [Colletotrichum chlorophyti]|uniref:Tubulin-specific chaperone E n=1 Tax=Colletotrichum chlorophyti TaxID=708187 RepID=A0A1Q8R9V6_9PEZI|nr:Tubulin-specific chaperone E [Colletotrichum chlorophyti]